MSEAEDNEKTGIELLDDPFTEEEDVKPKIEGQHVAVEPVKNFTEAKIEPKKELVVKPVAETAVRPVAEVKPPKVNIFVFER